MTLGYAQGTFIPSWPDAQRTTDELTRMQELRRTLFPGSLRADPVKPPSVLLAVAGLVGLILLTHHLGKGRGHR